MPKSPQLIDSQPQLDELCDNLADTSGEPIACDTEFVRTRTYWPQLCVIQVSAGGSEAAVDILADLDTQRLRQQLLERPETEIFHAAKQDLEALYSVYEQLPRAIFDTQIAAGLLGLHPQIGYAAMVMELLGIELPKDQTRTDWSRRPLSAAQVEYALEDVAHLHELFARLGDRLRAQGRFEWALEDSAALLDPSLYAAPLAAAWRRLPAIAYLPVPEQARARGLAGWREARARKLDRPRQWVLADKAVLAIAHANPARTSDLAAIDDLPPAVVRRQGDSIVEVVRTANAAVRAGAADFQQQPLPPPPDRKHLKRLADIVRHAASDLGIAPEILATRREVTGILHGRHDLRVLGGWRRAVVGERLLESV